MGYPIELKMLPGAAVEPAYQSESAAGFDLAVAAVFVPGDAGEERRPLEVGERLHLGPYCSAKVGSGIALSMTDLVGNSAVPWVLLAPRSGIGSKGLRLMNTVGVVDADYQGELILNLRNESNLPIDLAGGQRVAQALLLHAGRIDFVVVDAFSSETERGEAGFGSTGG